MKKITLVEDEENLVDLIRDNLEMEGYGVSVFTHGGEALKNTEQIAKSDLIILDVMLPEVSGIEICKRLRTFSKTPVLFLSAKGTTADKIVGLKSGGNDYLSKPFDLEELLLRVNVLIGDNQQGLTENHYSLGDKIIDFESFEVRNRHAELIQTLTKKEFELLKFFVAKEGKVVSRDEILETVWGNDYYPTSRTIDNFILHFRKLFESDPKNPVFFHSIRGIGYRFTQK